MAKSSTDTCCLTLPLQLEKWQEDRLSKRLEIARQLYNTLLRYELKKLRRLEQSSDYRGVEKALKAFPPQEGKKYTPEQEKVGRLACAYQKYRTVVYVSGTMPLTNLTADLLKKNR